MVYQATSSHHGNVIDVKVCSISFQRHCNSLLIQQKNQRISNGRRANNPRAAAIMAENQPKQQQLPVVELKPFVKQVWRREKSLPDFYDRKFPDENSGSNGGGNSKGSSSLEVSPSTSRLVRELTDTRKSLETRQNTMESAMGKYRSHPKAEFSHESNKTWRKQDLIPSFITRFERTRTSADFPSKENSFSSSSSLQQRLASSNNNTDAVLDNLDTFSGGPNFPGFKVKGGKMSQHIHRRHLLYLNPLESYRQPNNSAWGRQYNSTDNSRHGTGRSHLAPSRDSFPLSSGRARELLWGSQHFNHPLKPIQRDDISRESPHKFNSKLGAAKSSLQILNRMGAPTKLEKALEKEYEMNLERFRRDRLFLPQDLRSLTNTYMHFDNNNPTIGETLLQNAREANKAKKRAQQGGNKPLGMVRQDTSSGWYTNDAVPVPGIQRFDTSLINQTIHPINTVLHEEAEYRLQVESGIAGHESEMTSDDVDNQECQKTITFQLDNNVSERPHPLSAPLVNSASIQSCDTSTRVHCHSEGNVNKPLIGSLDATPLQPDNSKVSIKLSDNDTDIDNNNDNNNNNQTIHIGSAINTPTTNLTSPVDSSRLETNIDYLNNLQRKSKSPFLHQQATPTGGVPNGGATRSTSSESANENSPNVKDATPTDDNFPSTSIDANDTADGIQDNKPPDSSLPLTAETQSLLASNTEAEIDERTHKESAKENDASASHVTRRADSNSDAHNSQRNTSHENELDSSEKLASPSLPGSPQEVDPRQTSGEVKPVTAVPEGKNTSHKANSVVRSRDGTSLDSKPMEPEEITNSNNGADNVASDPIESTDVKTSEESEIASETPAETLNNADDLPLLGMEVGIPQGQLESKSDQSRGLIPEDEGISMATPIEAAALDSSLTEAYSDPDGLLSGCADNGDSGVSTTFITADESKPKELGGLVA